VKETDGSLSIGTGYNYITCEKLKTNKIKLYKEMGTA